MSDILFLCPTHRNYREIEVLGLNRRHRIHFHDYASLLLEELVAHEPPPHPELADPRAEIRRIVARYGDAPLRGVVSIRMRVSKCWRRPGDVCSKKFKTAVVIATAS